MRLAKNLLLQLLILFTIPIVVISGTITEEIDALCQNKSVILIGEIHRKPVSSRLFLNIVQYYKDKGENIFVGLEIPSDQQVSLDKALAGGNDFSFIHPIINHLAYQKMIHTLGQLGGRVTTQAIDGQKGDIDRDIVMDRHIMRAVSSKKYDRILVLVGSSHTIKNIKWHTNVIYQRQLLAGLLLRNGGNPCSIRQIFTNPNGKAILIKNNTEASYKMAMKTIYSINHSDEMTGDRVCDAFIEWK